MSESKPPLLALLTLLAMAHHCGRSAARDEHSEGTGKIENEDSGTGIGETEAENCGWSAQRKRVKVVAGKYYNDEDYYDSYGDELDESRITEDHGNIKPEDPDIDALNFAVIIGFVRNLMMMSFMMKAGSERIESTKGI